MYKVKIATIKEFQESRDAWNKLALAMSFPSIFCTWEWIYTWWEHFGRDYEPVILFVYKDAELVGILPLAYHKTLNGALFSRKLSYCGSMELYPDHLDIICSKEDAEQCLDAVFEFLRSEYKEWDMLNISLFSEGSNLFDYLSRKDFYFDSEIKQISVAPYITLSGSFDEFSRTLSGNLRKNIRASKRKLLEQYDIKYILCDPLQSHYGLKTLFTLHEQRAKRKNILSTFNVEHIVNFHNSLVQRISKNGWLWLGYLRNEEKVIAASYCFAFGGHIFSYQKGIDTEWERYSSGTIINYETIKEAFSKNYKEFDFLRGNEEHKRQWTKQCRALFSVNIYNKTVYGNISRRINYTKDLLKRNLKKFM
jgi:CelD/BcsL family acetyltransferase involved in cellulose biosynthesis